MPTGDTHQIFAGAVAAHLLVDHFGDANHKVFRQHGAVVFRKVGHLCKIAHAPLVNPLPDLPHPHLGLLLRGAMINQHLPQRLAGEPHKIHRPLRQFTGDRCHIRGDRGRVGHVHVLFVR